MYFIACVYFKILAIIYFTILTISRHLEINNFVAPVVNDKGQSLSQSVCQEDMIKISGYVCFFLKENDVGAVHSLSQRRGCCGWLR